MIETCVQFLSFAREHEIVQNSGVPHLSAIAFEAFVPIYMIYVGELSVPTDDRHDNMFRKHGLP